MAGINEFTKLLLHCNGSDGSTTFTDELGHSVTATNAEIDTAQSKFGGASGLFSGSGGSRLSIPDSDDWNFGSGDFTIDFWVKFNSLSGFQELFSQWGSGGSNGMLTIIKFNDNTLKLFYSTNGSSEVQVNSTYTFSDTNWHHVAVIRDGNTLRFFVDGISKGTSDWTGIILNNSSRPLNISTSGDGASNPVNGWIDEVRIQKGEAFWTSDFTPLTEEYSEFDLDEAESLVITDSLLVQDTSALLDDSLLITDSLLVQETSAILSENLIISDSLEATIVNLNQDANYGIKIISYNPLIFVTDTFPAEIGKIDTTDPENLTWDIRELIGANNAQDAVINLQNNHAYVACALGIVVKVNLSDLTDQEIIDVSDTDDLTTISAFSDFGLTYVGTNNPIGELYLIDERSTFLLDSDFRAIHSEQFLLDSDFNLIRTFKMDTDFRLLAQQKFLMQCDFKCITNTLDQITPLKEEDWKVYIDDVEVIDPDLLLNSIEIFYNIEQEESQATFSLSRKHDDINHDLDGNLIPINSNNTVRIELLGIVEFEGTISSLNNSYQLTNEIINVTAYGTQKECVINNKTLSLPSLNERLSLYHILTEDIDINDYEVDPNSENPKKYKGVKAPLGNKIRQSIARYLVFDSLGAIADDIQDGSFVPQQNWTYFWHPTVSKFANFTLGQTSSQSFDYIGTSLSPISSDLWDLTNAKHRRQRIFDDIITRIGVTGIITIGEIESLDLNENSTELFNTLSTQGYINGSGIIQSKFISSIFEPKELNIDYSLSVKSALYELLDQSVGYYVGEAPFKQINPRNGWLVAKERYEDGANGLYLVKDAEYDFREFVKKVVDLEYEKLKNINGDILPDTSLNMNITLDNYQYYDLSLLNRINIDNTSQNGTYTNLNGFPVSIKSITLSSATMQANIQADNVMSTKELEVIDGQFPDDTDEEYNIEEKRELFLLKSDMRTGKKVD